MDDETNVRRYEYSVYLFTIKVLQDINADGSGSGLWWGEVRSIASDPGRNRIVDVYSLLGMPERKTKQMYLTRDEALEAARILGCQMIDSLPVA